MILLSIGHNKESKGACNGDICEFDIASDWIQEIHKHLNTALVPCEVVPSGSLSEKVNYINEQDTLAAIELHFNSNINARGSECLHYPESEQGMDLARRIQFEFNMNGIFQPNRGIKEGWYYSNGEKSKNLLYFLKETKCPSVIIEPQFIYYINDIMENRQMGCLSIANALTKYYYKNS